MKIYKIAAILLTCCFLAGCQSGTEKAADTKEQNEATQEGSTKEEKSEFPDTIQLDVSENVKVNAECFYPEDFVEGEGVKVIQPIVLLQIDYVKTCKTAKNPYRY